MGAHGQRDWPRDETGMSMNLRDLKLRLRALIRPGQAERDLRDELSFHIEREARKLIDQGLPPEEAALTARARFGSETVAADQCRDQRGLAFFDNTVQDIQYALRTFWRAPLTALTIVGTVSLGLGVVAVLFTIVNTLLFRVDRVPDVDQIYAVQRPEVSDPSLAAFTKRHFDALRAETDVFTDTFAALTNIDLRVDGRMTAVNLVSADFFRVVRVQPVLGRTFTAADESEPGGNAVVVLSHKGWDRHFNKDPNVLGRRVTVNGAPFEIIGVMPEGLRGLEMSAPDLWAPLAQLAQFRPMHAGREDSVGIEIVGRLKPDVSKESARAQLAAWDSNQAPTAARTVGIELVPKRGTDPQPLAAVALFTPLFFAFGLILMIGCANVANLLLARGVARQREIGIRLSIGASRRRIVRQLLTESVLLALAAAAGGYVISRVALERAVTWMWRVMPMDLGDINLSVPAADWRVAVFLVVAAIGATAMFALIPALQATRIEPVRTLRGELVKDSQPGRARNVLIGVQVFASALLLICSAIFLRSAIASARFDPGIRTADTILLEAINEPKRAAMLRAFASESLITLHAAVRPPLLAPPRAGLADSGTGKNQVRYKFVSAAYFDVLGIQIVRGRPFTPAEGDAHPVAIVSESLARSLWPNGHGVGETFRIEADPSGGTSSGAMLNLDPRPNDEPPLAPRMVTVVGVARDVPGFRITDVREAGVFLPTSLETPKSAIVARVQGDPDLARQALIENLTRVDPNMGMLVTLRTVARLETFFLEIAFWVSVILGGLALLLTVSGLFSVLSYLVEQRTKEIGVRMALGASSQKVTRLMLAQTAGPVIVGLVAGGALAAALATVVLATPAGGLIAEIVHISDPVAYATSLAVIIVACLLAAWIPAARAAKIDPMRTLRQE